MVRTLVLPDNGQAPFYGYALAVSAGKVYVICTEGVGWEVTSDRPLFVDSMAGGYELPLAAVMAAASLGKTVDLADHIRTFGSRLDSNHYQWHARLTGK